MYTSKKKRISLAYLLWLFLGGVGGHHFYLGDAKRGFLYAFLCIILCVSYFYIFALASGQEAYPTGKFFLFVGWVAGLSLSILCIIDAFTLNTKVNEHNATLPQQQR